jgi:hypothetical protein
MDGYNMSSAISLGNSRMGAVQNMNESIREFNKKAIDNASKAATVQVGKDEETGIMSGVKDALTESVAMSNFKTSLNAYQKANKAGPGAGGFTEVKPTSAESAPKGAAAGEEVESLEPKPPAAITTSEGTLGEGSDVLTKPNAAAITTSEGTLEEGSTVLTKTEGAATALEDVGKGAKVAGALGKGVGVLGGIASSGLDIAADVKSFKEGKGIAGDNWEEKLGNVATIGGTALDMLGFVPGFQLAGVIGTGLQALGGISEAAGEAVDTAKKIATDSKPTDPPQLHQTAQASLAGSFAATR